MKRLLCPAIDKNVAYIMKGVGILCIAVHNMLHWKYLQENESTFIVERPLSLWNKILYGDANLTWDFLSFFGWYGVPIFIFLSGYGLAKKYDTHEINVMEYLKYNYFKLLFLLLPAFLLYVIAMSVLHKEMYNWVQFGLQVTFLNDIFYLRYKPDPGVYWYFGLTLQLYLFYLIFHKFKKIKYVLGGGFMGLFILFLLNPSVWSSHNPLIYMKHNLCGWIPICLCVILYDRKENPYRLGMNIIIPFIIGSGLLLFGSSFHYYVWVFSPFCAVLFILHVAFFMSRVKYLSVFFVWMGKNASFIFVIHPIIRPLSMKILDYGWATWLCLSIYIVLSLIISPYYGMFIKRINKKFLFN